MKDDSSLGLGKTYSATDHPQNFKRVCVFGTGPMGRAAAVLLSGGGAEVRLLVGEGDIDKDLSLVKSAGVTITEDIEKAVADCLVFFFAVPVDGLEHVVKTYAPYSQGYHIAVHGIRGITEDFSLPHQIIRRHTNIKKIAVLGGPLYFDELMAGQTLVAVIASRFYEVFELLNDMKSEQVLLHYTDDVIGVEIAGAISNITAIMIGVASALGMGNTTRGMLLARGLSEATTLGTALGASEKTFSGLAGVGDLIPRKVASIDRHIELGSRLVEGESLQNILDSMPGSVEGVETVKAIVSKAAELNLELPLMTRIHELITSVNINKCAPELLADILKMDLVIGSEAAALGKA